MSMDKDDDVREQERIREARHHLVVKSNDLIQKARFSLTLQEQKIVLYLISQIKPDDADFIYREFSIVDFCKICGIDYANGGNYKNVKDTIKALSDKSLWLMLDTGIKTIVRWINKAWIDEKSGTLKVRLDDDMKPYLLQLRSRFTQYELYYTLAMRSQYSIRLYELLRSYEYKRTCEFELDELKLILDAEKYARFPDFKRKVLDIAMREIEAFSDLDVTYKVHKNGRKFAKIEFTIKLKRDIDERLQTWARIEKSINPV